MVEQSVDPISQAFKSRVSSPAVFLQTSVNIRTDFLEPRVKCLPVFLRTSIKILAKFLESRVNQLIGAVKAGLNRPKGSVFAILSLLEERVDVGCQIHEPVVDIGSNGS